MSLSILHVASECVPFAKAGGLGDVVGALPKSLNSRGHDVRVLLPKYASIDTAQLVRHAAPLGVPLGDGEAWCALWEGRIPGSTVPIYFLEHDALYGDRKVYKDVDDVHGWARFALLNRAAFQLCRHLGFKPDVIHGHDWPTSALAAIRDHQEPEFHHVATVLSLHNVAHQPRFPPKAWDLLNLPKRLFAADFFEDHGFINPFKGGVATFDHLVAVSVRYAWEITTALGGAGLHEVFRARASDLSGIQNGVDTEVWNPSIDPRLPARYSVEDLSGKAVNKAELQREAGLAVESDRPLLGMVCRMTPQKGVDLVVEAAGQLMELGVQLVVLGSGDLVYQRGLEAVRQAFGHRVALNFSYDEDVAHRIEAGSDFFLMPSRFEPCGLNQMYSQLYGTPPIARRVGGLVDSVVAFPNPGFTGFLFDAPEAEAFAACVRQAVDLYRHAPNLVLEMRRRGMELDFSWDKAAHAYEATYRAVVNRRLDGTKSVGVA